MKTKSITHSKIKNPGILFELLVRQITVDTLEGKESSSALNLMSKYFKPSTELGKELQLYRSFFEVGKLTEMKAAQFIDIVASQYIKLDDKKLLREKYELIKEVRQIYDIKEFLGAKIPSYKIYASVYKTLLAERKDFEMTSIKDVAESRFTLIEHLATDTKNKIAKKEDQIAEVFKNQTEDLRLLSYRIMIDKFNSKYNNLGEKQKTLLREYINSVTNSERFADYVKSEIEPLKKEIYYLSSKEGDKVLKIKLNEVASQLENIKSKKKIRDNELTAMIIAYQIVEELRTK